MDIVQTSDDPHPEAGMDEKSLGAQTWFGPPPSPYRSLDILTQKILNYKIKLWSIKKMHFSDRAWVGRWYWSSYVLKHVYQLKTKKLFIDQKTYFF